MITALPTPPQRSDSANFAARADTFLTALPTFGVEANELASDVNSKQSLATSAANTATTQAGIATTAANTATTKANEASTSASNALTYAQAAQASSGVPTPIANRVLSTDSSGNITWRDLGLDPATWQNLPTLRPSLLLDFANSRSVDPRITFTRASAATRTNEKGLIETVAANVPRIDFDPVTGACKGLLIEGARTNRCPFSADVGFGNWSNGPNIQILGRSTAPDGTNTATVFGYLDGGGAYAGTVVPVLAGETVTVSAYFRLKAGTLQGSSGATLIVDDALAVRKALYIGAEGTPMLDGTWRRHSITTTNGNTAGNLRFYVAVDFAPGPEIEVWGAQIEAGPFPTSYIPTTTTEVTRASEIAHIPQNKLNAFTKPNSGTVFAEYSIQDFSKTSVIVHSAVAVGFEGGNYSVELRSYSNASGGYDSDTIILYPDYSFDSGASYKGEAGIKVLSAVSYGSKGVTASAFGGANGTNTSPFTPSPHSVISLGNSFNTSFLYGHIRRVGYFPAELPITELQALTTP